MTNTTALKLAEQALAAHKRKLASAADKDSVRRAIRAAEARLRQLQQGELIMTTKRRKRPTTRITIERHYPNGAGWSDGWQVIVSNPLWLKASPVFATQAEACRWARDYVQQES